MSRVDPSSPAYIGHRLEPLIDSFLIDRLEGLQLQLHPPTPAEKVLRFDRPWEGPTSTYVTVLEDQGRFRLYYRGSPAQGTPQVTCYAESEDGVNWTKPSLGLVRIEGSGDNNVIWAGPESHNLTPFLDTHPAVREATRYKALGGEPPMALGSADGLHWMRLADQPVLTQGRFDSQNVAFWDGARGCYAAYYRVYRDGVRTIARSLSDDFLSWSAPQPIDLGDSPVEHLYTSAAAPYFRAPHLLLALPSRFLPERQLVKEHTLSGLSDTVLMTSRDGIRFDRSFMEAFVRPGPDRESWTDRGNMAAWGLLPTGRPPAAEGALSLYVTRHYHHPSAHLQRFELRTDGFASLRAPYAGGEWTSRPLVFDGDRLILNYSTSAAGGLRVELIDPGVGPLPGHGLEDCDTMIGDEIAGIVRWRGGSDLSALAGRPLQLRFVIKDADLYAIRFPKGRDS